MKQNNLAPTKKRRLFTDENSAIRSMSSSIGLPQRGEAGGEATKTLKQFLELNQTVMFKIKQNRKIRYLKYLNKTVAKAIVSMSLKKNEIEIFVYPVCIHNFLFFLKHHFKTQLNQLMDITAVDYPQRQNRFEIVYNLLSIQNNLRFTIKSSIDSTSAISSVTSLYSCASWWEREVWDMFGIFFFDHPDCRRILTDYGFKGHPLRKDFPLSGYVEVRYDDSEKRVVTEPVELAQEFRFFDFSKSWVQIPTMK